MVYVAVDQLKALDKRKVPGFGLTKAGRLTGLLENRRTTLRTAEQR